MTEGSATYEADGPDDVPAHTEWNGWLYCEHENEAFDWQTGEVECPHCGDVFDVQEPTEVSNSE